MKPRYIDLKILFNSSLESFNYKRTRGGGGGGGGIKVTGGGGGGGSWPKRKKFITFLIFLHFSSHYSNIMMESYCL